MEQDWLEDQRRKEEAGQEIEEEEDECDRRTPTYSERSQVMPHTRDDQFSYAMNGIAKMICSVLAQCCEAQYGDKRQYGDKCSVHGDKQISKSC